MAVSVTNYLFSLAKNSSYRLENHGLSTLMDGPVLSRSVIMDTCQAMEQYTIDSSNSTLGKLLPCIDTNTANDALDKGKQSVKNLVSQVRPYRSPFKIQTLEQFSRAWTARTLMTLLTKASNSYVQNFWSVKILPSSKQRRI